MKHILILSHKLSTTPNEHQLNAFFWVHYCIKNQVSSKIKNLGYAILKLMQTIKK